MLVDIHNHILPGLDDGPTNWDETLLLAKQAVENGISHVIATPHHKHQHKNHFYVNNPTQIINLVNEANRRLLEHQIPLEICPGIEFHLHKDICKDIAFHITDFLTLNNTGIYVLLEPPCSYYPEYTDEAVINLQKKGFKPILAHPERNKILRRNPDKIYNLVQRGVLIQITAGSIRGIDGKRLKNFSLHLLDHELVHLIASDAHHFSRRKFELRSTYEFIENYYSSNYTNYLKDNAEKVLQGLEIHINKPTIIEKKWQYFFSYNHPLNEIKVKKI